VLSLAFSNKDNLLVSGSHDRFIKLWNFEDNQCIKTINTHMDGISRVLILPGGYVACASNKIQLWDLKKSKLINSLEGHSESINSLLLLSDDNRLVSVSEAQMIIWNY
jgi:WD40 repeat protein